MGKYVQTIEEEYSYFSRTFDIICERSGGSYLQLSVQVNGKPVEIVKELTAGQLEDTFENLKFKYLTTL